MDGSFVDTGLAEEVDYAYRVIGVSVFGIDGAEGQEVIVRSLLDTIAPTLVSVTAIRLPISSR